MADHPRFAVWKLERILGMDGPRPEREQADEALPAGGGSSVRSRGGRLKIGTAPLSDEEAEKLRELLE